MQKILDTSIFSYAKMLSKVTLIGSSKLWIVEVGLSTEAQVKIFTTYPMVSNFLICFSSELTLYHTTLTFNGSHKEALWKQWEKEKMLVTSIFFFSHKVFYCSHNNISVFRHICIVICKCFQFGLVYSFVVW